MTRARRYWLLAGGVAIVLLPIVVLSVGRWGAFDLFSGRDSLDDSAAQADLVVCFRESSDRFAPNEVAESILTVPLPEGGFNLLPGVDDFSIAASEGIAIAPLRVDLNSSTLSEGIEAIEGALRDRAEVATVLRSARAADCAERTTGDTTTATR